MTDQPPQQPACGDPKPHAAHNGFASEGPPWCIGVDPAAPGRHKLPEWSDFSPGSSHLYGCAADLASANACDKACIHHLYALTAELARGTTPLTVDAAIVYGPHSRACGITCAGHGVACNPNCPTCGARPTIALPLKQGVVLKPGARI